MVDGTVEDPPEPAVERLPRGRHGLTREQVELDQRIRMLAAMADVMSRKGYVGTTVADVIKGAGVSRETFYQQFSSKLDCFTAAFDAAALILSEQVQADPRPDLDPVDRFDAMFARYLESLAAEAGYARLFLVEVYAAGPEAMRRRAELQSRIVDTVAEVLQIRDDAGRFACEMLVASISSMVTGPIVEGDLDALRALRAPVVEVVRRAFGPRP